ncbi:MAG TPA: aldose 1-epimerase family protein [Asanoa sp.]|nr:aldose 1-epimerase family protein [Asanoa sp.]
MITDAALAVPLSGEQYEITAGPVRATVVAAGGGLRELHHGDRALVLGYDADEPVPGGAGQLLMPWPNRVAGGRYRFAGEEHRLVLTEPTNAVHGLVRWATWTVDERATDRIVLRHRMHSQPGYPHVLDLAVTYQVSADGLRCRMSATNVGSRPAPYGHGAHPYLTVGLPLDECVATVPAERVALFDERSLPVGITNVGEQDADLRHPRALAGRAWHYAYTDLVRDEAGRDWSRLAPAVGGPGVALWVDEGFGWLQVYSGDGLPPGLSRRGLAIEPMSCPPDAFNSGIGLVVLAPGERCDGEWGIAASGT